MQNGVILLLIAEFLFALSTIFVKYVTNDTQISGVELSFFRFSTGFIITSGYFLYKKEKPIIRELVIGIYENK